MDQREIEELLPFYAMDAVTDEERILVESYIAANPEAQVQLEEMTRAASSLPHGVSAVDPPPRVKDAFMRRVREGGRAPAAVQPPRRVMRLENIFQTLSLGAAAVAIIWAVFLNIQISRLQGQVSMLGDALVAQSNSLQEINSKLSQPTTSPIMTISLAGTDVRPGAHGQLIADPGSKSAVLVVAGLGQLEPGKTYQVWLIDGSGPRSAGLLSIDSHGQGMLIVTSELSIGEFISLGISIEPEGGSEQPTGEIVVLSDL